MSSRTNIVDGTGQGYVAKVDQFNTLWVRDLGIPPTTNPDDPNSPIGGNIQTIYREFLSLNGDGVITDARQNGSLSSPVLFSVLAESGFDIYVTSISFVIADANLTLSQFGNIGPLTNGLNLYYQETTGQINIGTNIRTNFELIRLSQGNPSWGDPTGAFIANNVLSNSEAVLPVLDFRKVFGIPYGIKLRANSSDKIVLEIRDDIRGVDQFDAIAYGTRIKLV